MPTRLTCVLRLIAIGLCDKMSKRGAVPGWNSRQWAYHADDGMTYGESGAGRIYSHPWGEGDTIGCGLDLGPGGTGTIFFTKNGTYLRESHSRYHQHLVYLYTFLCRLADCGARGGIPRDQGPVVPSDRDAREKDEDPSRIQRADPGVLGRPETRQEIPSNFAADASATHEKALAATS
jgi:SPRY domain